MDITTTVIEITPRQAACWLESNNRHNRSIREPKVAAYTRDMLAGAWRFNGDAIRFAADGTLLDGQHRLLAIVRSGLTIMSVVVFGLDVDSQDTMDVGAARRMSDQLALRGEANASQLAAVARRILQSGGIAPNAALLPTHAEIAKFIAEHPGVRRAAEVAAHARRRVPAASTVLGAAYFVCAEIAKPDAETFYVTQVMDGVGLYPGDPAHTLRSRFQSDRTIKGRQMAPDDAYRYSILAWNRFRRGVKISKLQAPHGGWTRDHLTPQ